MLVIAYKQRNQTHQILIPPIFLQLTQQVLSWQIQNLIAYVYQDFRSYLSPFVSSKHLRLELPSKEILYRKTPLYLYLNYGKAVQEIFCNIGSIQDIRQESLATINQKNSLIMRISPREEDHSTKNKLIFTNKKSCEDLNFHDILRPNDRLIIRGRQIISKDEIREARWFLTHWRKYQNKENQCLYLCIDRS